MDSDNNDNDNLFKIINQHLGKTHYDPYFDRPSLSDKAVQFSTLRLQYVLYHILSFDTILALIFFC